VRRFLILSWGNFFLGLLIFVIFTFFKEGIGSNLTMPYALGILGLGNGSWKWVLNLVNGSWVLGLVNSSWFLVLGSWFLGLVRDF